MIDAETGMADDKCYGIINPATNGVFDGVFRQGKFYDGEHVVGWLDGNTFIYSAGKANGQALFPDLVVGSIHNLKLKTVDGRVFGVREVGNG